MNSAAITPSTESSISSFCQTLPIVAMIAFTADLGLGERVNITDKDRLVKVAEQVKSGSWRTPPTAESQTYALSLHKTQGTSSNVATGDILDAVPLSDRVEAMYSTWTRFFFHAFSILFIAGIGILTAGSLWAIPLVSASGPLVLGIAFGCLWYCVRRATQEHAI